MKSLSLKNVNVTKLSKQIAKCFSSSAQASEGMSQKFHNIYIQELKKLETKK